MVLSFPETMHNMDFDQVPGIHIEGSHEKIDIMQKVELPAFFDQGIAQNVSKTESMLIRWFILDFG